MADVQFEEENQFGGGGFQSQRILGMPTTPGMVRLLGKLGIRDEKVAGYILIAIAIIAFATSIFIFAGVFKSEPAGSGTGSARIGPPPGEI